MSYAPDRLALTLSRRCNIQCGHCIVEAGPREKEVLDPNIAERAIKEASINGLRGLLIYGGEPFLFIKSYLPKIIKQGFTNSLSVYMSSNGFWGRTETSARETLGQMEDLSKEYDKKLSITLSVDEYHQRRIPPASIANIISQFRLGDFPHIALGVQTLKTRKSWSVMDKVYQACHRQGVYLVECNDNGYMYPALPEELIEFTPQNYSALATKLDLPVNAGPPQILEAIRIQFAHRMLDLGIPNVIARKFDAGKGTRPYTIFPKARYLVDFCVEKRVIKAGRARENGSLELHLDHGGEANYLIIAPNGQAYVYPAQMTAQQGISIGDKPLLQVIREVEHTL